MDVRVRRGFADIPDGQIHYAEAGSGDPVLLLHQTPRSWDEYRDVLPLLGRTHRAIAMDTIGFGDSTKPPPEESVEGYGRSVIAFLDAMGLDRVTLVGHHTGGVIAIEVAATHPERVAKLVISSAPFIDAEDRRKHPDRPPIDEVDLTPDGRYLTELWQRRARFYPEDRPDLLQRFVIDALKVIDRVEEGHRACHRYRMEDRLPKIQAPTHIIVGGADKFSSPHLQQFAAAIGGSTTATIPDGMVPMVDQLPEEFAAAVLAFLKGET